MLEDVVFRPVGSDAKSFTVSYWKVEVGETVEAGADLVVVESTEEKTALTVPSPSSGVLREILAPEEEVVEAGALLGRIEVA